jgi:aspartyl-tRNA(Asn)/glutamyl-tRNA(Gln) amidotransferase subunit C
MTPDSKSSPPVETVRKIAELARLDLAADEEQALAGHFGRILEHFRVLEGLDVTGAEAMLGASRVADVVRPDTPAPSFPAEAMLANAPAHTAEFYVVPKTVGGDL